MKEMNEFNRNFNVNTFFGHVFTRNYLTCFKISGSSVQSTVCEIASIARIRNDSQYNCYLIVEVHHKKYVI